MSGKTYLRKIKNGKVKIKRMYFSPQENFMKYDGRLDGEIYAFFLYDQPSPRDGLWFCSLWGDKQMRDDCLSGKEFNYGKELVDGRFPWLWWDEVKDKNE